MTLKQVFEGGRKNRNRKSTVAFHIRDASLSILLDVLI